MNKLEYLPKGSVRKEKTEETEEKKGELKKEDRIEIKLEAVSVVANWIKGAGKWLEEKNWMSLDVKLESLIIQQESDLKKEKNDFYIYTFLEEVEKQIEHMYLDKNLNLDEKASSRARKYIEKEKAIHSRGIKKELEQVA